MVASYEIPVHEEQELYYEYKNYTGRTTKDFYFAIGQKKWILKLGECRYLHYDSVLEARQMRILPQIYLPFYFGFMVNREYLPVEAVYGEEAARNILEERLDKNIASLEEKGVQIIQKNVTINAAGNAVVMEGVLQAAGSIGSARPLEEQQPAAEDETISGSSQ